jgi:site-specific DNA-cytosine methylase
MPFLRRNRLLGLRSQQSGFTGPASLDRKLVLASLSARQAKAKGLLTSGTCGLRGSTLSNVCRPDTLFGEQVSSADGTTWLDLICSDLEGIGYRIGTLDIPAASVGAPHRRQRLYFVADTGRWISATGDSDWEATSSRGMRRRASQGTGSGLSSVDDDYRLATWRNRTRRKDRSRLGHCGRAATIENGNARRKSLHRWTWHIWRTWTTPQAHDATARGQRRRTSHYTAETRCEDLNAQMVSSWATPRNSDTNGHLGDEQGGSRTRTQERHGSIKGDGRQH